MDARQKTKFTGVYKLISEVRRYEGKPDVCFYIYYKHESKLIKEKVGWLSEGYNAADAAGLRAERIRAGRHGDEPAIQKRRAKCITFAQAWAVFKEKWLPNLARPKDEESRYTLHLKPVLGDRPLDRITPLDLETLKQNLFSKGLSAASVRIILGDVRRIYNKVSTWGLYTGTIPTNGLKLPRPDNARQRYLTPKEAANLMEALKKRSLTWWGIAMISLHTGMRIGEILALRLRDLDFGAGVIHVLDAKAGTRMTYMTETIKPVLASLGHEDRAALLFTTTSGAPMRVTATSKTFSKVVEDMKLNDGITDSRQKVVFHSLRHTFCSWLAIRGVPLYDIGELVGHSRVEMTKRYAHLCPDKKRQSLGEIDIMAQSGQKTTNEDVPSSRVSQGIRVRPSGCTKPVRRPLRKLARRPSNA